MNHKITILERAILESLINSKKNIDDLTMEMGLPKRIVLNFVSYLVLDNLIIFSNGKYQINENKKEYLKAQLTDPQNRKNELIQIVSHLIENNQFPHLRLKKIYLSEKEMVSFKIQMAWFNSFLDDVQKRNAHENTVLGKKHVVFMGVANYEEILKSALREAA